MINQINDDINKARSHKNDEKISRIIFIGEFAIVNIKRAAGGPNARNAQPKNSATVMLCLNFS